MTTCPVCGGPMKAHRITCSKSCSAVRRNHLVKAQNAEMRRRRVEDVEWLLGGGERPELIAGRLKLSPWGLAKSLIDAERPDLADVVMGRRP